MKKFRGSFLSALIIVLAGCQHTSVATPVAHPNPLYGTFPERRDRSDVILVPQWHLSPQMNTKDGNQSVPQTENQLAIYYQLSSWISDGSLQNVVVEGCEGEVNDGFTERFNGWTLQDLKTLPSGQLDTAIAHIGLKLKARYGNKIRIICGDNLALIKRHQLILSDLRGLSGFKIRISQFKNDKAKREDYVSTVRSLLQLPESSREHAVISTLDQRLREKVDEFEDLVEERNKSFLTTIRNLRDRSAIVIGAIHELDLRNKLHQSSVDFIVFHPTGLKGDESELIKQIRMLLEQSRSSASIPTVQSCRAQIRKAICLAEPPGPNDKPETRTCSDASQYARQFEELYDVLPGYMQKMFCHLEKIFIEKQWQGTSYAGVFYDDEASGKIRSGFIGIRQSLLDMPSSATNWASWKEQINFGVRGDVVTVSPGLPIVKTSLKGARDMLYLAITHELGHVFDYSNSLNHYDECSGPYGNPRGKCTASAGSWTELSWTAYKEVLPSNDFPLRKSLCFYFCNGKFLKASQQDELYRDLSATNFLTPYSTRFASEDFAEFFMFYNLWKERNASYQIETADGYEIDVIALLNSPRFKSKKEFLERFLQGPIIYPGQ